MTVNRNPLLIPRKSYFTISPGVIRQQLLRHGLDHESVEAITQTLHRLFDKFGADERLNYDVIEEFMQHPFTDTTYPIIVAASDSSPEGLAIANYICDGIADDVQIQAAIDAVAVYPSGRGKVILLEGTFNLAATITFPDGSGIWVEGVGYRQTKLVGSDSRPTFDFGGFGDGCRVSNIWFSEASVAITWDTISASMEITNNCFESCLQAIVGQYTSGNALDYYLRITDNLFSGCGTNTVNGVVELLTRTSQVMISRNVFDNTDNSTPYEIYLTSSDVDTQNGQYAIITNNSSSRRGLYLAWHFACVVADNSFNGPCLFENISYTQVTGNVFYSEMSAIDCSYSSFFDNLILATVDLLRPTFIIFDQNYLESSAFLNIDDMSWDHGSGSVRNNTFNGGVLNITNSQKIIVDANEFNSRVYQVINLDTCINIALSNNLLLCLNIGDHAGATIELVNSDKCHVHGNTGRRLIEHGGSSGHVDYFISIDANCDRTKCWGNDGYDLWDTAAVLNSGTNTDLTTANR